MISLPFLLILGAFSQRAQSCGTEVVKVLFLCVSPFPSTSFLFPSTVLCVPSDFTHRFSPGNIDYFKLRS